MSVITFEVSLEAEGLGFEGRGGSTLGQGHVPPRFICCPKIQKLADRSDVISEVRKCSKVQIFRGSGPTDPLADGERGEGSLPPFKNPPRSRPLGIVLRRKWTQ